MFFKPATPDINFPEQENQVLSWWYQKGLIQNYLKRNRSSRNKFSFLDGPITANNPMGVHHAWGRTYKDIWQKYNTMLGKKQRFQNGFDCQGLWVEVEVEKELGFKTKKDIESYGVANFVNKCKDRVRRFSSIQTQQSRRLGYFMDWDNSYFTMSDENNYAIWNFLKVCQGRGWVYKGHDSVPWCPRCETAISQHEILTEDYKEIIHETIFFQLPVIGHDFYLVAWTTTPWTIPANVALAVNPKFIYSQWKDLQSGRQIIILREDQLPLSSSSEEEKQQALEFLSDALSGNNWKKVRDIQGAQLLGLKYRGPFDNLPRVAKAREENPSAFHSVVDGKDLVVSTKGTGILHIAPGAGEEDFHLAQKLELPVISVIADNADYLDGLGEFSTQNAKKHPEIIIEYLKSLNSGEFLLKSLPLKHRYPACWRCKTELVWKITDEWYIAMDKPDPTDKANRTLRQQMVDVTKKIKWIPPFGLERELDWLRNMHDWLISKKNRYWGLALPIYECFACGNFDVIGGKKELEKKAVEGWEKFVGNTPHRPWIDYIKIDCSHCGNKVERISDVGNPWLDAGIVSFSTLPNEWFPADFITESFPGQFKNWFYALIAMSTVLAKTNPFKVVLGYASLMAENGQPMHKSAGNMIEFNDGAEKIGVDVMRWLYASQKPESNLSFGYSLTDQVRRQFLLILWNIYNFFTTYANIDQFDPSCVVEKSSSVLDQWIKIRCNQTISQARSSLDHFDASSATTSLENFVSDLSLWYVRRSRDRVGPSADDHTDKIHCHRTLYQILISLCKMLAPFTPFVTEVIYQNLTLGQNSFTDPNISVHLQSFPESKRLSKKDLQLALDMETARLIVEKVLSLRKKHNLKVRQPLAKMTYSYRVKLSKKLEKLIAEEVNIKAVSWEKAAELLIVIDTQLSHELIAEGQARDLIRKFQELRKQMGLSPGRKISGQSPSWPQAFEELIKKQAQLTSLKTGLEISLE